MNKIELMREEESGLILRPTSNPDYSFYGIRQTETVMESALTGTFARQRVRTVLVTVPTHLGASIVADIQKNGLDGKILVKEFTASELPEEVLAQGEDILARNIKRAGNSDDAPICTKEGEPIYSFKVYMSAAQIAAAEAENPADAADRLVKHDNKDAIQAHRVAQLAAATKAQNTGGAKTAAQKAAEKLKKAALATS